MLHCIIVQLQIIHLLNLQYNVPLMCSSSLTAESLVLFNAIKFVCRILNKHVHGVKMLQIAY